MTKYHELMARKSIRAFYYLLWICIREARHNKSLADTKKMKEMADQFGDEFRSFLTQVNGGEAGISTKFLSKPPNMDIGTFCRGLAWQFYKCSWNGGYGGKKWGVVTDCLVRFVSGEFSAEMMLDTVWTLAHNGGADLQQGAVLRLLRPDALPHPRRAAVGPDSRSRPVRSCGQGLRRRGPAASDDRGQGALPGGDRPLRRLVQGRGARRRPQVPARRRRSRRPRP